MKPLNELEYEKIVLDQKWEDTIRIKNISDPSNFLHAICKAYFIPYINESINKIDFVKSLRKDFSKKLGSKINVDRALTYYDRLKNGEIKTLGKTRGEYSLQNLQTILASYNVPIPDFIEEYICDVLGIQVYIIDSADIKNIKKIGNTKGSDFIALLSHKLPNYIYYEIVGMKNSKGEIQTRFSQNSKMAQIFQ